MSPKLAESRGKMKERIFVIGIAVLLGLVGWVGLIVGLYRLIFGY